MDVGYASMDFAANPTVGMSIPSAISIASLESINGDVEFGAAWGRWGLPRLQE